jgi:hypothetical protein
MKRFLRVIRGVIGTGLSWALGWAGLFAGIGAVFGAHSVLRLALSQGFVGFIAGSAFGVILSIVERHKKLEDLSTGRVALWGGLGGLLVAGSLSLLGGGALVWPFMVIIAVSGAACSAGTIAIAKRAGDSQLIERHGEHVPTLPRR